MFVRSLCRAGASNISLCVVQQLDCILLLHLAMLCIGIRADPGFGNTNRSIQL